ncbi:BspA family leucine-rich repeat surface protein [Campylobacter sp. 2457A]|nr:BspA family leucine-rich repeat surface protein [Campylobacter sp. 2457A]
MQLLDAIEELRKASIIELRAKREKVLNLFNQGAIIPQQVIDDLGKKFGNKKNAKNNDEYNRYHILLNLSKAEDKSKFLNENCKYTPKSKPELKKLIKDINVYLGDLDTSKIKSFKDLFRGNKRKDFSGIETWDVSKVTDMENMFEGCERLKKDLKLWNLITFKFRIED